jgi:hypothetical protein
MDDQKCIDLPNGDVTNGNKLEIWDCNGHTNQQWFGGGVYQFTSGMNSNKCMDLFAGDTLNGKLVEIWDCDQYADGDEAEDSHAYRNSAAAYRHGDEVGEKNVDSMKEEGNRHALALALDGRLAALLADADAQASLAAQAVHAVHAPHREIRMYWNTGDPEKNLDFVRKHGAINETITGVLPCCNIASIDANGTFVVHRDITSVVQGYKRYNLTVDPVASVPELLTIKDLESAKKGIPAMVSWAKAIGADGVLIDYEPSSNYTAAHAQHYADFLAELDAELLKVGKGASCDLASWGILDKYSTFCGKLSSVTTMSTWYQGNNLTLLEEDTLQIVAAGCAASTVHVGISDQCKQPKYPSSTCAWTPAKLDSWVTFLLKHGIAGLDTWTPDSPANTPGWYFAAFQRFLRGSAAEAAAVSALTGTADTAVETVEK